MGSNYSAPMCKNFERITMGKTFATYVMLVSLGNCEMVLGIQWFASLGPTLWDFDKLRMKFKCGGQKVVLRGTQKSDMEWLGSKKFQHQLHKLLSSLL